MVNKCPKCGFENPEATFYCGKCATPLPSSKESGPLPTETLQTPVKELATGSTFAGRYQIIEELGKGGMGKVYKVYDTKIKEKIALKLIRPEIASDRETIERFSNELRLSRKIGHRNVCRMFDLGEAEGAHFITMEYVHGEDLKSMIRMSGSLSLGMLLNVGKQVCSGLSEAHSLGIVHRDLKPTNIMIDKGGNAKIMDFGIARSTREKGITGPSVLIGTPEYMSPEQAEAKEADPSSDIYSLGVILYEMATSHVPFEGETALSIAMKHKGEIPKDPKQFNPNIPDDLSRVILRCLEKDKADRYQTANEILSELEKIEKGVPIIERVVPERKPFTSRDITVKFSLKKAIVPVLVLIGVVAVAIAVWKLLPRKEAPSGPKIENSIAVISFENQTGDEAYDYLQRAIPNLLISSLEQRGSLYVATWERLHDLLKQIGKGDVEFIDSDTGFSLCRREGVGAIVLGSFVKAGDVFVTDVKVLDVETKKMLKSASSRGRSVDSILERQIDELSREISQSMGVREKSDASQFRIADMTTTSMEAYDYFLKGEEARGRFYNEVALDFYKKAISLDPNFALCHLRLGNMYGALGYEKERDQAYERAMELSKNVSEKERLRIEALYTTYVEKDSDKYFRQLVQFSEKYPKDKWVHAALGGYYYSRDWDKALEEYNQALLLDPNSEGVLNSIAYHYMETKEYPRAIGYLEKAIAAFPESANLPDSMGEAYFQMGMIEEAISKYKDALAIKPDFQPTIRSIAYLYALKEDYPETVIWLDRSIDAARESRDKAHTFFLKGFYWYWLGDLEASLDNLNRAEQIAEGNQFEQVKVYIDWLRTWIFLDRGKRDLSRRFCERWFEEAKSVYPRYGQYIKATYNCALGSIELREAQTDLTKKRLSEVKSLLPAITDQGQKEYAVYLCALLQAELFLAEGFPERCAGILEKTPSPEPPRLEFALNMIIYNLPVPLLKDTLARAYKQRGDFDTAIAAYEKLIVFDPESPDRFLIHPLYHYRLAKLYEEKGWKGKAIDEYQKFLDLWKDADPGLSEVEDAKARLAAL